MQDVLDHISLTRSCYNRNCLDSSLLRLPAELRRRICELVVGGHHVKLRQQSRFYADDEGHSRKCEGTLKFTHSCISSQKLSGTYDRTDGDKFWAWPGQYNDGEKVTILPLVCRQLHQETTLMMLELNLFSFSLYDDGLRWINSMMKVQCRALKQVFIEDVHYFQYRRGLGNNVREHLAQVPEIFYDTFTGEVQKRTIKQLNPPQSNPTGINWLMRRLLRGIF
jgi:hypothetical protein